MKYLVEFILLAITRVIDVTLKKVNSVKVLKYNYLKLNYFFERAEIKISFVPSLPPYCKTGLIVKFKF